MLSSDSPRDIFGQEDLTSEQVDKLKTKLQWAVNHLATEEQKKKAVTYTIGLRIKWLKSMVSALNHGIRFKSTLPIAQELGGEWEREIGSISALYHKFSEEPV
jgi:hypothetical protein